MGSPEAPRRPLKRAVSEACRRGMRARSADMRAGAIAFLAIGGIARGALGIIGAPGGGMSYSASGAAVSSTLTSSAAS